MTDILLTRSQVENEATSDKLSTLGFNSISLPIISYQNLNLEITDQYTHIIITSKYAAKLISSKIKHKVECWVVGKESAAILQNNPNITVTGIAKNIKSLLEIIALIPEKEAHTFFNNSIYYSGDIITEDLPEFIKRQIIYEISYLNEIEDKLLNEIQSKSLKYIMVYSKNCGIRLINLIHKHNLLPYLKDSVLIAISAEVADLFSNIIEKRLYATEPSFENMLKLLIEHDQQQIQP